MKLKCFYEPSSILLVGEKTTLKTVVLDEENQVQEGFNYHYEAIENINTVSIVNVDKGSCTLKGEKEGEAKVKVTVEGTSLSFTFGLTIVSLETAKEMTFVLENHNSNIFERMQLRIGNTYDKDIIGSLSNYLYTEALEINHSMEENQLNVDTNHGGVRPSTEFICVHYTGNMRDGANAWANASYFSHGGCGTSIHYTTGNDGIYHILDNSLVGFHAGDGHTDDDFYWRPTGVKVLENDPLKPVWGISKNSLFTINGRETNQKVPEGKFDYNKMVTGVTFTKDGITEPCINKMGLGFEIINGEYYMGTTWWCHTQVRDGRICNKGGNFNSIGIESCVNEGSDLWYTWQKTAKLVAHLMKEYRLGITRVVGHHFFTAKNCPQPMLENDLELWKEFIKLVLAEYDAITKYQDNEFKFELLSGTPNEYSSERVTLPEETSLLCYQVTVKNNSGQEKAIKLYSIVNQK